MSEPFVGEIRIFAGNFPPIGWAMCNGQLLSIEENTALFQLLGTTYGGDGQQTFALPDLQSRIPLGPANTHPLGQKAGAETVTLAKNQLPRHSHALQANSQNGDQASGANGVWSASGLNQTQSLNEYADPGTANATMGRIDAVAGGQPHNNIMPILAVNFIIALEGIFPSQN